MCTHCQHSTEWRPTAQDSRGHLGQPISGWVIEFICICSTSVTYIGGKLSKLKLWTRIYIGINERRCTSWQNHLKMWSIYWVMLISQCDQESIHYCHLLSHCYDQMHVDYCKIKACLNGCCSFNGVIVTVCRCDKLLILAYTSVQGVDFKVGEMIHLWRGLTLKQI